MQMMNRREYLLLSQKYDLIPVCCEINADLDTPVGIFKKVFRQAPAYLLESAAGSANLARYSFIGIDPFLCFYSRGQQFQSTGSSDARICARSPLDYLEQLMAGFKVYPGAGLPRFFGGAVGYLSYGAVRYLERIAITRQDVPDLPESYFIFAGTVLVFDHVKHTLKIVFNSLPGEKPESAYDYIQYRLEKLFAALKSNLPLAEKELPLNPAAGFEANIPRDAFLARVAQAKKYIKAGDILQVVLSQRLRIPFQGDPFNVYRRLRALNPSPYLYYLDLGEFQVIGSSPEMLVRVEDGMVETCPIAGTRPRGGDRGADEALAAELLSDEKEKAEHLMLVDLGRNDLGKVCAPGSIKVSRFMEVEKFSHVMHLVSRVKGSLSPGKSCYDALRACFPAGTVTGAPKVRAMQIIDQLEPDGRGVYAGGVGYFGFFGNFDTAIAIRTMIIHHGYAYVQAGAGIVADSDPAREYEETLNKARALLDTIGGDQANGFND